jgi:hypothetical protein
VALPKACFALLAMRAASGGAKLAKTRKMAINAKAAKEAGIHDGLA